MALIAGPTASGKSALAVRLAQRLEAAGTRAVIVNADSAQVYADLKVLSARPSDEEMGGIRHRLFGERDGAHVYSAADWAVKARNIIFGCAQHGTIPILVGGTGLYIGALLHGIAPIPRVEPVVRDRVRALSTEAAYTELLAKDRNRAIRLHPNDDTRIKRALEVMLSSGCSLTYWQSLKRYRLEDHITLHPLIMLPDRAWLYERCDRRFPAMLAAGAREEVEALLARELDPALPVMRAIGVREIGRWIAGEWDREEALAAGQQATRNYAKRQYTWFRHQAPADWPRAHSQACYAEALDALFETIQGAGEVR
ncbi:tRNA (adenosine(37)-N6)-dimethylallyltransferase MiaA [Qipengyuania sediminis]|uniref:tRNA (adenosine(37)-N6)-dimethylallyltransferase MiaA n=1 Tax=Qipengyuania sediminis TaxID=1532023 RepID=UPI003B838A4B